MKGFDVSAMVWLFTAGAFVASAQSLAQEVPRPGERAFLGVQLVTGSACATFAPAAQAAICVSSVRIGGAADRAGIHAGDVVERIGSVELMEPSAIQAATQSLRAGDEVEVAVRRGEERRVLNVRLEPQDAQPAASSANAPAGSRLAILASSDTCEATRTSTPGPLTPPFRKLPLAASESQLNAMLGRRNAAVVLRDDDVLTFAFRSAGEGARVSGSVQCALDRVGQSDLWALQLKMSEWNRSFLSAQYFSIGPGKGTSATVDFRGAKAPTAPRRSDPVALIHDEVSSRILGISHAVSIYLPAKKSGARLKVLYMTDGQGLEPFAAIVDTMIRRGEIEPIALIGVHSPPYRGDSSGLPDLRLDDRAREYLSGVDPAYFARYLQFFVDELMPWAEQRFALSARPEDRAVMGYSNGGAFALTLGLRRPEAVATVLPFSPAGNAERAAAPVSDRPLPRFLFAGGRLEPPFLASARDTARELQRTGARTDLREYWSGHDTRMWEQALADYLPQIFDTGRDARSCSPPAQCRTNSGPSRT